MCLSPEPGGAKSAGLDVDGAFSGLAPFDGEAWTRVLSPDPAAEALAGSWVAGGRARTLGMCWDGEAWTDYGAIQEAPEARLPRRLDVASAGSVSFDGRRRFDGDSMHSIDPSASDVASVAHAPDGLI